eukprot:g8729.t1
MKKIKELGDVADVWDLALSDKNATLKVLLGDANATKSLTMQLRRRTLFEIPVASLSADIAPSKEWNGIESLPLQSKTTSKAKEAQNRLGLTFLEMGSDFGLQCRALQRALSIVAAVTLSNLLGHKQLHVERAQPPQGLFVGYPGTRSQYASQSLKRRASVTEVSPAELESSIRRGGAVVLDVYAVWCGPCKLLEPALNILADKLESDVEKEGSPSPQVLRMDSDRHSAKASEMGVEGLPTIIFFNEGVEVGRLEGAVGLGELEEKAAEALGLAELSGGPSIIQLNKLEDLEVMVQLEEMEIVVASLMALFPEPKNNRVLNASVAVSYWAGEISTRSVLKEKLKRYEQQRLNEKIKEVQLSLTRTGSRLAGQSSSDLQEIDEEMGEMMEMLSEVDASVSHLCESAPDESVKESLGGGFKGPVADDKMLGPLRKHPNAGRVWITNWPGRFQAKLGQLRDFLESHPDKFTVIPQGGRRYTVAFADRGAPKTKAREKGGKGKAAPKKLEWKISQKTDGDTAGGGDAPVAPGGDSVEREVGWALQMGMDVRMPLVVFLA